MIASPKMDDPNFQRSVILMLEHNDEGAMGLVINRPLAVCIDEAWNRISDMPCAHESHVFQGGPCPGPLMVLHREAHIGGQQVASGLYVSSESPEVERLMGESLTQIRFVIGYAGWGAQQLEDEMHWGVWRAVSSEPSTCFKQPEQLWLDLLRQVDPTAAMLESKPHLRPSDPSMN